MTAGAEAVFRAGAAALIGSVSLYIYRGSGGGLFGRLQPGHAVAQTGADLFDLAGAVLGQQGLVFRLARLVLGDPFARELAALDLVQHGLHAGAGLVGDDARAAGDSAPLGRFRDEVVHLGDAALVEQVHDQLQLVQAFEIGDLGLVAGLDQGVEALDDQLLGAAAQDGLFAEQVGLRLFAERGLKQAAGRPADSLGVAHGAVARLAGRVLLDGEQGGDAAAARELAADQIARSLGRDQDDIHVVARGDAVIDDREAVREQQGRTRLGVRLDDVAIDLVLDHVGRQDGDDVGAANGFGGLGRGEAVFGRVLPTRAAVTDADDHVMARVLQVLGVGAALRAIADDGDALTGDGARFDVVVGVDGDGHGQASSESAAFGVGE